MPNVVIKISASLSSLLKFQIVLSLEFTWQVFVSVIVTTQPFYIAGLDPDVAPGSAYGAVSMFLFTFCASAYGIYYDNQQKAETGPEGYQLNNGAPVEYGSRYD